MLKICSLVVAAGRGTRAGLPYPKTLFPIQGLPILLRIFKLLHPYDEHPTVVVSPEGKEYIDRCLRNHDIAAELIEQPKPFGMGDAVLRYKLSATFDEAGHILLIWGDIPFVQPETVKEMINAHQKNENDFTFVTRHVEAAYTLVSRTEQGKVSAVVETREVGLEYPPSGERDIGLFIFRKQPVFDVLQQDLPGKFGQTTKEHGFLYVIAHLVEQGLRVEALPIATELDIASFNSMKDIQNFI